MKCKALEDWSDDENDNDVEELVQPSRDFPISENEEENEEDDYDMYELSRMTINKHDDDLFQSNKSNKIEKTVKKSIDKLPTNNKKKNLFLIKKENINQKRKFSPRLPPPEKYKKNY